MRKYFIHNGQTEMGPFEMEQLNTMQLKSETPVWFDGLQNWTTAGNIPELQSIINSYNLPPKFENPVSYKINPPIYTKPDYGTNINEQVKKNNTVRNIFFAFGIIAIVFLLGMLFLFTNTNDAPPYNAEGAEEVIDSAAVVLENAEPVRDEISAALTEKNRSLRNSIENYVGATTNYYTADPLGGLTNLDVSVTNNTEYLLDEVVVEVEYIKDTGGIYKTEIVSLYNIPANQDKFVSDPDSDRGTSVRVKLTNISSKALHICYYNEVATQARGIDPFFCK